jgi:hypothetical protein
VDGIRQDDSRAGGVLEEWANEFRIVNCNQVKAFFAGRILPQLHPHIGKAGVIRNQQQKPV